MNPIQSHRCWRMLLQSMALVVAVVVFMGSTTEDSGLVVEVLPGGGATSDGQEILARIYYRNDTIYYDSNPYTYAGEISEVAEIIRGVSTTAINGRLVSLETFVNAALTTPNAYLYRYENCHYDLIVTGGHELGMLRSSDAESATVEVVRTNRSLHYGESDEIMRRIPIADDAQFFIEDAPATRAAVLGQMGRWIQVHPQREQVIWVETDASVFQWSDLPDPDEGVGRTQANSLTGMAIFRGWTEDALSLRWDAWQHDVWQTGMSDTLITFKGQKFVKLDGRLVPATVGLRPGRHFAANHYRSNTWPHQWMLRTWDDEIRGVITAVTATTVTIEAETMAGGSQTVTVPIESQGRMLLDGSDSSAGTALQAGRRIRVFPARSQQRVVALLDRQPLAGDDRDPQGPEHQWAPVAYYQASATTLLGAGTVSFDGSHSYHPSGHAIVAWHWEFGDGTSADGPQVSHSFSTQEAWERFPVRLTITDEQGKQNSWVECIELTNTAFAPVQTDMGDLVPGMVLDVYDYGKLVGDSNGPADLSFRGQPGTMRHEYAPDFNALDGTKWTPSPIVSYQGYVYAPQSGLYTFRAESRLQNALFEIDGVRVIDMANTVYYGPFEGMYRARGRVYLAQGFHAFRYEMDAQANWARVNWDGPGVSDIDNVRQRMHLVFYRPQDWQDLAPMEPHPDSPERQLGLDPLRPIPWAGADQWLADTGNDGQESVQLDGSASTDIDGDVVAWYWSWNGGSATGPTPQVVLPAGQTVVDLVVVDDDQHIARDQVVIQIGHDPLGAGNRAPHANGGSAQVLTDSDDNGFEWVDLDGTNSYDVDGQVVTWRWSWNGHELDDQRVRIPLATGFTLVTLTVVDDDGATNSRLIPVTILGSGQGNLPPVAQAGPDQSQADDDEDGSEIVQLDASASFDVDGTIASASWSWAGGSASGLTASAAFPRGSTLVTLTLVDDDGASATDTVSIVVTQPGGLRPFMESGGLLVIEAEHFDSVAGNGDDTLWTTGTATDGYAGSGYITTQDSQQTGTWGDATEVTYRAVVASTGTYHAWVRRYAAGGGNNSFIFGIDGAPTIQPADNQSGGNGTWTWKKIGLLSLVAGERTIHAARREPDYRIDRFLFTTDPDFIPVGAGPDESQRGAPTSRKVGLSLTRDGAVVAIDAMVDPFDGTQVAYPMGLAFDGLDPATTYRFTILPITAGDG